MYLEEARLLDLRRCEKKGGKKKTVGPQQRLGERGREERGGGRACVK